MRPIQKLLSLILVTLLLLPTFAGCWGGDDENTLTMLAGSELRDLEPLFDQIENETGVKLEPKYVGILKKAPREGILEAQITSQQGGEALG